MAGVEARQERAALVSALAAVAAWSTVATAFKLGLGAPFGDGRQYMPWIAQDDMLGIILTCVMDDSLKGPVNAVAPQATTNEAFTRCLTDILRRPTAPRIPKGVVRAGLGELGDELLLTSTHAVPSALQRAGFRWDFPSMEDALRFELGRALTHGVQPSSTQAEILPNRPAR